MKKNSYMKFAAALLGSVVTLTGCIEETFPESGYATTDQIGESPFAANGVVTAMSTILITNYTGVLGDHVDIGYPGLLGTYDRLAGEVFPVSGNMEGGNQYYDRWQWALYPGNSTGLNNTGYGSPLPYYNYYQFIYTANSAISVFSVNPGPELGVAKIFRAMSYLDMARLYDPLPAKASGAAGTNDYVIPDAIKELTVPIVTEETTSEQLENNPRATREEIFTLILSDLSDAESLLADYKPTTSSTPSLAVAYGLKARAYLWLGQFDNNYAEVPTGTEAYKLAATYARKAIEASGCTITTEDQWLNKTTGFCKVISSWMWAMCQSTDTILNNLLSWTAHMAPDAVWGYGAGAQPGISVFSYNRLSDTDFRKKIFVNADRDYAAIAPYMNLTEEEFEGSAASPIAPYCSFKFHTNNGEKYDYSVGNVTDIPLMRVEEMYLTEAEAVAHYDEGQGRQLLSAFMAYRDPAYTASSSDIIDEILFQKRIEFWGEGIILYDMKRLNVSLHTGDDGSNAPNMDRFVTDGRAPWWNLVIPLSAEQQNTALDGMNNPNPVKTYLSND